MKENYSMAQTRRTAMSLNGKVAIITGGGKGMGRVISKYFAQAGADLVLVARTKEPMEEMAEEARQMGRRAVVYAGDASLEEVAEGAVKLAIETFGKIDILVNNTGIEGPNAMVSDVTLEEWNESIGVNLTSAFLFCKKVTPYMQKQKSGSIIHISSLAGTKGIKCRTPYCASKWGMLGLSRAVAEEVGPDNVRSNVICPGAVHGERMDRVFRKRAIDEGITYEEIVNKTTLNNTPLRRQVEPDEIAQTAVFLASDAASGITGEEILVTGGRRY
jgi:NAD(P)-dependent dehydrogenase (short-subunit alcohol dehydrogenase family)